MLFAGPAIVCPNHPAPVLPDVPKPLAVTQHVPPPPEHSNPVAQVPAIPPMRAAALVPQMPAMLLISPQPTAVTHRQQPLAPPGQDVLTLLKQSRARGHVERHA